MTCRLTRWTVKNKWQEAILPDSTLLKTKNIQKDLLSQVNQHFGNQHNWQFMAPKHDTDHGNHNPSNPTSNPSVDGKLVINKDESISSVAMQDQDHTDIMDKLAAMVGCDHNTAQGLSMIWLVTLLLLLFNQNHQYLNLYYIWSQRL